MNNNRLSKHCLHLTWPVYSVAQSCLTLCDSMDCSPPGSSVHGMSQARILRWVPFPPPGIFLIQGLNMCLLHLLHWQAGSLPLSYQETLLLTLFCLKNKSKRNMLLSPHFRDEKTFPVLKVLNQDLDLLLSPSLFCSPYERTINLRD